MNNKKIFILSWVFIIACILAGGFLGIYIIGKGTGDYNYDLALPMIGGTAIGILLSIILYKWGTKRKRNVPDFDERSILLMKRYFLIVLYVVLVGSGAVLLVLYAMGVHTIETGMLILCLVCLYMLIGIGAFVTKRL